MKLCAFDPPAVRCLGGDAIAAQIRYTSVEELEKNARQSKLCERYSTPVPTTTNCSSPSQPRRSCEGQETGRFARSPVRLNSRKKQFRTRCRVFGVELDYFAAVRTSRS